MKVYRTIETGVELDPVIAALIQARKDQNVSQEELADRLGTSQAALSQWEGGKREPRFTSVMRWAEALGFRPWTLEQREEAPKS